MESELKKVRIALHEWRAASEECFRVKTEHEEASDIVNETYAVHQAATKERIALDKYHRAVQTFNELFGDLPFSAKD